MWDLLDQPISTPVMLALVAVMLAVIYLAIQWEHKKSRDTSRKYLAEHPDAATLYLYAEDLPSNGAEIQCIRGTASKLFEAKCIPQTKVSKGMACHVLPGTVEFNGSISWTKNYYAARKHGSMSAHFTFQAEAGRSYAAIFDTEASGAKLIHLD